MSNWYYLKYEKFPYAKVKAVKLVEKKLKGRNSFVSQLQAYILKRIYFLRIMLDKGIYLNTLAIVTSYKCTLNCDGCGQHTPLIREMDQRKKMIHMERLKRNLNRLLSSVNGINHVGIAIGEAFVNENLLETIELVGNCEKIMSMNLPTNGTVLPKTEILNAMKKYHVSATITKYPCVAQEKIDQLTNLFDQYGILYSVYEDRTWYDLGTFEVLNCTPKENQLKYKNCERQWILMNESELWKCVVHATAVFCGKEKKTNDFVDLKQSGKDIRQKIYHIASKPYLEPCTRCHGMSGKDAITIPAGRQI